MLIDSTGDTAVLHADRTSASLRDKDSNHWLEKLPGLTILSSWASLRTSYT
jgi:hypothetical protein